MAETSKIEWCDATFNPWMGCTKVSPGCDNCYAEAMLDKRWGKVQWGPHGERKRTSEENWNMPRRLARKAREAQEAWENHPIIGRSLERPPRPRVFCASLADVWDNQVPQEWRADLFRLILDTPELDWLLLTKRPENIRKMMTAIIGSSYFEPESSPIPNIWLGFTAEDQEFFNDRWDTVRGIPAVVKFCSYEPAIGPLRLFGDHGPVEGLDWLICGGESGQGYRWMKPEWEANIRLDCQRLGVRYFFKQLAGKKPIPRDFPLVREFPNPKGTLK